MAGTVLLGLMIPFAGHGAGRGLRVCAAPEPARRRAARADRFAAGVMVAASVWSLLIPAMDQAAALGAWAFLPAGGRVLAGRRFCCCWTT